MSDRVGLIFKMLLPSVALAIAIHYFSPSSTPIPNERIVLGAVFGPSIAMALGLWWQGLAAKQQ
jgi:hypothetical protein